MAIYERTQRESAHVSSRVVDKSKVPSATTWAALGCVTASKGELNHIYQVNTTDLLASIFGEPSKDHIALVCADKIISEDNMMYLIRVAHENSLRGAQVVVSTDDVYGDKGKRAIGVVTGEVTDGKDSGATSDLVINVVSDDDREPLKNIADELSMEVLNSYLKMENASVLASYREVYQLDANGNKAYSEELCLLLSDVLDQDKEVVVRRSPVSGQETPDALNSTQYEVNWYYSEGYSMRSAIVLKPSSSITENTPCDVVFEMKQVVQRAYGTNSPNKVIVPVVLRSSDSDGDDDTDVMTFITNSFLVTQSS